jgi:hypothetical protein
MKRKKLKESCDRFSSLPRHLKIVFFSTGISESVLRFWLQDAAQRGLRIRIIGEPLWLSGKVAKNEKINEFERTRAHSPPRATSFFKKRIRIIISSPYL